MISTAHKLANEILSKPIILLVKLLLWLSPSTVIAANLHITVNADGDTVYPTILANGSALLMGCSLITKHMDELFYDPKTEVMRKASNEWLEEELAKERDNET